MSPIEIDPLTGAPILKPVNDPILPITELPPVTEIPEKDIPVVKDNDEGDENDSKETGEKKEEEVPKDLLEVRQVIRVEKERRHREMLQGVSDVLKRYTSDSQSHDKAFAEIKTLLD